MIPAGDAALLSVAPTHARMLAAAKTAVRVAARLAARVQAGISPVAKADASPVTVADFAAQAAVALVLVRALHGGGAAVRALLAGGAAPRGFRLLGEEDAGALRADGALLAAAAAALGAGLPPRDAFCGDDAALDAGAGGGAGTWAGADVLAALGAGAVRGGAAAEGEADGADGGAPRGYWVVDPIDGTKGFLRGGQWAVGLAFVSGGAPALAALAAPALPVPTWAARGAGGGAEGALFAAARGAGATVEPLFGGGGGAARLDAAARGAPRAAADLVLCESFEAAHSDHGASAAICDALGVRGGGAAAAIRVDSMVKYGLLARGCGDVYVRLPKRGYAEKVWDHAPGDLLLSEAGGVVTDARGRALDFSRGATLDGNEGVIAAADAALHARAVDAARAVLG